MHLHSSNVKRSILFSLTHPQWDVGFPSDTEMTVKENEKTVLVLQRARGSYFHVLKGPN